MDDKVTYQIGTALGTSLPLTGKGLEQIIDPVNGSLIALLYDGTFVSSQHSSLNTESAQGRAETVILEAA